MKKPDLQRIEALFQAAADLPADERAAYLERECSAQGGQAELRAPLEAMLAQLERNESLPLPALARENSDEVELCEGPGTIIGRFKLLQKIGEGGFGVVYMAEQQEPVRRRVALKIIKLGMDTKEVVARFEAERQALALMDHPNIARVLDGGATTSGRPYFVMELVRGVSITEYCDEDHLSTRARLELFIPVCLAVQHAHQKGVIHRDIKPSNVMVTLHDGQPVPKVIDFGVAKAMHGRLTEKTLFTAYERFIGTPAYMSPEQAELSGLDVDTRTDIYSLGVLLYELLTGTTPFDAKRLLEEGLHAIRRTIREQLPERPSLRISTSGSAAVARGRRTDLPALSRLVRGDLDWIVMRCLEKERIRRYESASELAADIEHHLRNEPVLAGPPSALYRARKLLARNRAAVLSAGVVLLGLLVGLIGLGVGLFEAERERGEALAAQQQAERQAERTRAASDFLIETLAQTAPAVALDANLSVATLLQTASAKASAAFADQPAVEGRLRVTLGRGFKALGENRQAEQNLRRGIELLEAVGGVEAPEMYAAMWDLTHVLFALERPDAMVIAQAARRVAHGHIRTTHPELAEQLDELVEVTNDAAFSLDPVATERLPGLFRETVRLSDRALAPGHELWPLVADTWIASGYSVWYGPLDGLTTDFFGRALEIQERELPANHPVIGLTTGMYVNALNRNGRASEAESVMRASLARLRTVLPADSPELAVAEGMLGENLASQGRYREAEPLLLASYAVIRAKTGEVQSFTVADALGRVLAMYAGWGREDQAAPLRAELASFCATAPVLMPWPIFRMMYGPELAGLLEHLDELQDDLVQGPYSVGTFTSRRGTVADTTVPPRLAEAVRLRRQLDDADPIAILTARQILVWTGEIAPGLADETRRLVVEDALAVLGGMGEVIPAELARCYALRSELELAAGDRAAAAKDAYAAWRLLEGQSGDWMQANVQVRVALCLLEQGLHAEAESLLVPALELLVANFGAQNTDAVLARKLLQKTYTAWGRPEQAQFYADPVQFPPGSEEE